MPPNPPKPIQTPQLLCKVLVSPQYYVTWLEAAVERAKAGEREVLLDPEGGGPAINPAPNWVGAAPVNL